MSENIQEVVEKSEELLNKDISHSDLGVQNDFSDAETIKKEICKYQLHVLNELESVSDAIPEIVVQGYVNSIISQAQNIEKKISSIEKLVSNGVHNQNYPTQRQKIIDQFVKLQKSYVKTIFDFDKDIKLFKHDQIISDENALDEALTQTRGKISEIDSDYEKARKALGNIRDLSLVKSLKESAGTFDKLRENHSDQEFLWRNIFIGSIVAAIISVLWVYNMEFDTSNITTIISDTVKKLLLISIPGIAVKVSLKKFNIERNLKILYDHRATVLQQYQNFENSIGDDQEAKNAFRLKIAKFIFSDPKTGYISDDKSSEVSINPIVNLAEHVVTKG